MFRRLLTLPAGRRAKWAVLAVWLLAIAAIMGGGLLTKFDDAQSNESSSFLPGDAESTEALALTERLQGGEIAPIVIVYSRQDGLEPADLDRIEADRETLNAGLPPGTSDYAEPVPSPDGTAALLQAQIRSDGESDTITVPVDRARAQVADASDSGLEVAVTGGAGFSADAIDVFGSINSTLLLATAGIVFVLLLAVYRSPIFWFFPLLAVGFAEIAVRGIGYGLTELGVTVNGQSAGILPVLVFGAGTDYALLLVARYREELHRHEDKHEAMSIALRRAGPAIVASGLTVIAALLCLTIADVQGTAGLGPIGATGIAVAMISMLTLLPALLVVTGRWDFWPFVPRFGDPSKVDEGHGAWRRIANWIGRRPRTIWIVTVVVLLAMAVGWTQFDTGLTQGNQFRDDVESVAGQRLLERSFPAGSSAPTEVLVPDPASVDAATVTVSQVGGVDDVREGDRGPPGVLLQATLEIDPYSPEAFDLIGEIREAVGAAAPGALVGGPTAIEADLRDAAARDSTLIPPITLAVVLLILVALLRALVAPLLLIATVILSFVAALGVGFLVFDLVFDFPGADPSLPLFAFIFLVALGVDYNIFLMARAREETRAHGTREGMLRGLAVTGAVITSAGIVLAGTFSTLAVLPLIFLTELGFVVAFGVLLDTLLVRSILVPALVLDIGGRTWWPSSLQRIVADKRIEDRP